MRLFWQLYIPLVLLFIASFIVYDWTVSELAIDNDAELFDLQEEAVSELMGVIENLAVKVADKRSSSGTPSLDDFTAALSDMEPGWEAQYGLSSVFVSTAKETTLPMSELRLMEEQSYIIFDDPDNQLWGVNMLSSDGLWLVEALFEYPEQSPGWWMLAYWFFYSIALALVLGVVLKMVLDKHRRERMEIAESVGRIKRQFDQGEPGDNASDTKTMFLQTQLNEIESHINQQKNSHHQHYDDLRDLLHGVAHEFRSPMARASFALDMVEGETESEKVDLNSIRTLHGEMEGALNELDSLVKEVLSYSRLEHGKGDLDYELTTVQSVVQDVLAKQQPLFDKIAFEAKQENKAVLSVNVDRRLFYRVLINLIRNAARFADRTVSIDWKSTASGFELSVDDDGPGIPPGKRKRIFEPFTRLDPSRSRDSGGAGLGLAIVNSISALHGGTVTVTDSVLGGASFVLRWPAK